MTRKISILLTESELQLLKQIAAFECRRPEDQARFLVIQGLEILAEEYKERLDKVAALTKETATVGR